MYSKSRSKLLFLLIFFQFLCILLNAQDMKKVKSIMAKLTSPQFHGRGYVNEGDKKAANYIKDEFKKLKIKPFNKNYFQPFPIQVNTFPNKISLQVGKKKLKVGEEFIVSELSFGGRGKVQLFIFDSLAMQNPAVITELRTSDNSQMMVLIEEKMEKEIQKLPTDVQQKIFQFEAFLEIVKGKKTVASISQKPYTTPSFKITKETWEEIKKENSQNKQEHLTVIYEIESKHLTNYTTQNVLGYIEGTSVKDTFLVACAHYDHLGRMGKDAYFPGANDNASGVTMVLSLAEYFSKNPPKYSVAFILFSGEEIGLLGSDYFVKNPFIDLPKIKFLFNLDIVGTGDEGATIVNSNVFKKEFEQLNSINIQKKYLKKLFTRGKAANSDHHYFIENGVKAFYLYTMGGIAYYHHVNDKAETLPLTKFEGVFGLIKDFFEMF